MADEVKPPVADDPNKAAADAAQLLADRQAAANAASAKAAADQAAADKAAAVATAAKAVAEEEIAISDDQALSANVPAGSVKVRLVRAHWIDEVRYDPPLSINVPLAQANKLIANGVAERTDPLRAK